jgi:hypothetical protein
MSAIITGPFSRRYSIFLTACPVQDMQTIKLTIWYFKNGYLVAHMNKARTEAKQRIN